MNDMQKLAFEIGRQIEMEKLAVLNRATGAVKKYWGHLSGNTLKGAKEWQKDILNKHVGNIDSLQRKLNNAKRYYEYEHKLRNERFAKSALARKELLKEVGTFKGNADDRKRFLDWGGMETRHHRHIGQGADRLASKYYKEMKSLKRDINREKIKLRKPVDDAAKSQYKTRRNTAIGAGAVAVTGGGAYAYNKNKGKATGLKKTSSVKKEPWNDSSKKLWWREDQLEGAIQKQPKGSSRLKFLISERKRLHREGLAEYGL